MTAERSSAGFDVIVIGAGQAGLAIGYFLARRRLRFLILDGADSVGAAWRARWDSLVLFTPARRDSLPGLPFPGDPDAYPGRDEVIAYLERYADHFQLPIALNRRVSSLRARDRGYVVAAGDTIYEAAQVVVATGPFQVPDVPAIAGDLGPEIFQIHSIEYRNPEQLPDGPVLVVGGGNTGFQIADELAAARDVHLSIGSRQTPLPQRFLGRDIFSWLTALRLMQTTVDSRMGRRMQDRDALIGSSSRKLRRRRPRVTLRPRAVAASGDTVRFADATEVRVGAVIWATGFRLDHAWIDVPRDADGSIRHSRGVADSSGLYFLGLPWQHTRGSALLGWVKDDAEFVAARIAAVSAGHQSSAGASTSTGSPR